jgi:hypothetical protein
MKIKALKSFEGIKDLKRSKIENKDIFPKEGDTWEVTEERAKFLLSHGVIEIVEEVKEEKENNFKLDNNGNVNIGINTILDGKKIAEQLKSQLNTITTEEALKDVIPADLEEKPKKATKKKTSKK